MQELLERRLRPFATVAVLLAIVCLAMVRLPESFLSLLQRRSPFTLAQIGWAYRLLAVAAVAQALYGGFVLLRPDHVESARRRDPKLAALPRSKLIATVARTAASMTAFTLIYGLAAFGISGQRGGFWLFPGLALAQGAWYYRQVGQVATWAGFQPESASEEVKERAAWRREPPDYCPPLARGLVPAGRAAPDR
ncbi:MAG: hypothetical protein M3N53_09805 [Actinomycetota bacterium]|nr:hypothetical protein [Actinomycetota bacterium]